MNSLSFRAFAIEGPAIWPRPLHAAQELSSLHKRLLLEVDLGGLVEGDEAHAVVAARAHALRLDEQLQLVEDRLDAGDAALRLLAIHLLTSNSDFLGLI